MDDIRDRKSHELTLPEHNRLHNDDRTEKQVQDNDCRT
jgi:hypothetical protein